jgi:hypothetical protein
MPARCDGPGGAGERERRLRGELFRQFVRGGAQATVVKDAFSKPDPQRVSRFDHLAEKNQSPAATVAPMMRGSRKVEPMRPAPHQWPSTAAMLNVQEVLPGPAPDLAPLQGDRPQRG